VQVAEKQIAEGVGAPSGGSASSDSARVFFALTLLYLTYSRVPEYLPVTGVALIMGLGGLLFVFLTGNLEQAVKSRVGMGLIGLTVLIGLGIPFSIWPGGAFLAFRNDWLKQILTYYILAGGLNTIRDCKKAIYVVAYATATIVGLSLLYAGASATEGRLIVGFDRNTFTNPNYLAMYLVVGAPFCFYALRKANVGMKLFWVFILAYSAKDVLATGSRAALLAGAIGAIYVFAKSTMLQRGLALASVLVLAFAATTFVGDKVLAR